MKEILMNMDGRWGNVFGLVCLGILGAGIGSFVGCMVWRMRMREEGKEIKSQRSVCLNCKYQLRWYDNIPLWSWLWLKGKCRKCGSQIGVMEILAEILGALLFMLMGSWFSGWRLVFALLFASLGLLVALYDGKWRRLPVGVMTGMILIGVMWWIGISFEDGGRMMFSMEGFLVRLMMLLAGMVIYPGLYFLLYKISKEKWVGAGDYILAISLVLILGHFWLALWALMLANLLASLVMVIWSMIKGKKQEKIAFAPFMLVGFLLVWGISDWLMGLLVI